MGAELTSYHRPEITIEYIEDILKSSHGRSDITCSDLEVAAASKDGQNFLSELLKIDFAATIGNESRRFHWIAKLMPDNAARISGNRSLNVFEKEVSIYSDFFEKLRHFEVAFKCDDVKRTIPTTCPFIHGSFEEDREVLIMENLNFLDFRDAINKKDGFDLDHCKLVAEWLAKLHGTSYAYINSMPGGSKRCLENMPYLIDAYDSIKSKKFQNNFADFFEFNLENTIEQVKLYDSTDYNFSERLKLLKGDFDSCFTASRALLNQHSRFKAICHGDSWFNNIFFRYEKSAPAEVIMFDFQLMRYANPCTDLTYFFYMVVATEDRKNFKEDFLRHYHRVLQETFEVYQIPASFYSYESLLNDFHKYKKWGLFFVLRLMPIVFADRDDVFDANNQLPVETKDSLKNVLTMEKVRLSSIFKNNSQIKERIFGVLEEMAKDGVL